MFNELNHPEKYNYHLIPSNEFEDGKFNRSFSCHKQK